MKSNPLRELQELGQSIWLDYLRRDMLESGGLRQLIEQDGLRGLTSNPQIFWKAIDGSDDYTEAIRALVDDGRTREEIYRTLTVEDVQRAADTFRPVYDRTRGADGFVSLEVNPHLARDVDGTLKEARELWQALDRPNVMIKVPATKEGLTCIRHLTAEGINVNVTLLFDLGRYREVAEAYIAGLEDRAAKGESLTGIHSVASFFLSRIDVKVDPMLEAIQRQAGEHAETAAALSGEVAITSARVAYQMYREIFNGEHFAKLEEQGAHPQRLLWASTSTKNPDYSDVKYVEGLIGPETVNTVPRETLNAYRNHGCPEPRLRREVDASRRVLNQLANIGIDLKDVTSELVEEGIAKFNKPYDRTVASLETRITEARAEHVDPQQLILGEHGESASARSKMLAEQRASSRMWDKDESLWSEDAATQKQIADSLGWLYVPEKMLSNVSELKNFAAEVRHDGFRHVVLLGMGGSSLAPLVFEKNLADGSDGLPTTVLDTTDPATVLRLERELPMDDTLFIVASKSGSTTETTTFMEYFYHLVARSKGADAGKNFVVITDPGSPLVETAHDHHFRCVFLNYADIGGRYSALSYFGMVPAVLMGVDIEELLERAVRMAHANQCHRKAAHNPAIELGAAIGDLATHGRDKLTFLMPDSMASFGLWLEQLVAESTGKQGRGILPVAGEDIGTPDVYGDDRIFVYFERQDEADDEALAKVKRLAGAGHPVVIIRLQDAYDIGQEMMRWEIATAAAGKVLDINPFDQPNVQESKDITKQLLNVVIESGALPSVTRGKDGSEAEYVLDGSDPGMPERLTTFVRNTGAGDYIAIQAYLTESDATDEALQTLRLHLRDRFKVATTVGYGPRYLHSTGQYHKGGPNTGVYIQLVKKPSEDIGVPNRDYSFGTLIDAQAQGDLEALHKHERRAIRIDLGEDVNGGLEHIISALAEPAPQHA